MDAKIPSRGDEFSNVKDAVKSLENRLRKLEQTKAFIACLSG